MMAVQKFVMFHFESLTMFRGLDRYLTDILSEYLAGRTDEIAL